MYCIIIQGRRTQHPMCTIIESQYSPTRITREREQSPVHGLRHFISDKSTYDYEQPEVINYIVFSPHQIYPANQHPALSYSHHGHCFPRVKLLPVERNNQVICTHYFICTKSYCNTFLAWQHQCKWGHRYQYGHQHQSSKSPYLVFATSVGYITRTSQSPAELPATTLFHIDGGFLSLIFLNS